MQWLAIFIGGGLGSITRYAVSKLVMQFTISVLPWATLIANVCSCIVLVLVINNLGDRSIESWQKSFIIIGFCGGFSTFSTFAAETFALIRNDQISFAILNILLSVLLCLFVFWALYKNFAQN